MDKKDRIILQTLDKNVRLSYRQIGKKTRLSEETVQYRIKRMLRDEIITGFWGVPKIGNDVAVYKVLLKNKSLNYTNREMLAEFIKESKPISWAAETDGTWSYIITIMGKDWEAAQTMRELSTRFSKFFADMQILKSTSAVVLNEKYIHDTPHVDVKEINFLEAPMEFDRADIKIMNLLSADSRTSASVIGDKIGLTPEATARRIKKLIHGGAMAAMKVRINHSKLGKGYFHILLSFSDMETLKRARHHWEYEESCVFIMEHVGKYQMHLELVAPHAEISKIIDKFIDKFPEALSDYEICPISKELKIEPNAVRK